MFSLMGDLIHVRFFALSPLACETCPPGLSLHSLSDKPSPPSKWAGNVPPSQVSGEVYARDHQNSCLIVVWQDVCNSHFQSLYVRALFNEIDDSLHRPLPLPALHSPLSFTGPFLSFRDGEAVVKIDDHSHFQTDTTD